MHQTLALVDEASAFLDIAKCWFTYRAIFKHYLVTLSCLFGIFMEALRVMTSRTPETDNASGNWPAPQSIRYWINEET